MNEESSKASGRGALADFTEAIGDLFGQVAGLAPRLVFGSGYPRHELRVEDAGYRVKVDMPGIQRDAIDVSVSGRKLTVSAERPRFEPPEGARLLRRERGSGKIDLTVQLPDEVDAVGVTARMKEGVLEVWLPKPSETRGRKVTVETTEAGRDRPKQEKKDAEPERPNGPDEHAMPWE